MLQPRVVVLFGRSHLRDQIRPLLQTHAGLEWGRSPGSMERDHFAIAGKRSELFCLNHPSTSNARYWESSVAQLVQVLVAEPLAV